MRKSITLLSAFAILAACSSESTTLCDCVEEGAKVDAYAQKLLINPSSDTQKDSLRMLTANRDSICKTFIDIDPVKLEEERAKCEGIKINRD